MSYDSSGHGGGGGGPPPTGFNPAIGNVPRNMPPTGYPPGAAGGPGMRPMPPSGYPAYALPGNSGGPPQQRYPMSYPQSGGHPQAGYPGSYPRHAFSHPQQQQQQDYYPGEQQHGPRPPQFYQDYNNPEYHHHQQQGGGGYYQQQGGYSQASHPVQQQQQQQHFQHQSSPPNPSLRVPQQGFQQQQQPYLQQQQQQAMNPYDQRGAGGVQPQGAVYPHPQQQHRQPYPGMPVQQQQQYPGPGQPQQQPQYHQQATHPQGQRYPVGPPGGYRPNPMHSSNMSHGQVVGGVRPAYGGHPPPQHPGGYVRTGFRNPRPMAMANFRPGYVQQPPGMQQQQQPHPAAVRMPLQQQQQVQVQVPQSQVLPQPLQESQEQASVNLEAGPAPGVNPNAADESRPSSTSSSTPSQASNTIVAPQQQQQQDSQEQPQVEPQPPAAAAPTSVIVPWGWRRAITPDSVIYFSPSGIELKSKEEVKEYLTREGTCKCGLECPLLLDSVFDFDVEKQSALGPVNLPPPNPARYCQHREAVANLATVLSGGGDTAAHRINHIHDPVIGKRGAKKRTRKKRPYSGLLTPEMLEAREAERRRINEIIAQQKKEYEAQMSTIGGPSTSSRSETRPQQPPSPQPPKDLPGKVRKSDSVSSASSSSALEPPVLEREASPSSNSQRSESATPGASASGSDAKNVEIRRMSATEDGDKVLEAAWDSPEKEKVGGKTPLEMVQNIVSNIEDTPATTSSGTTTTTATSAATGSRSAGAPQWTQENKRPLLHSQKVTGNHNLPSTQPPPLPRPPGQQGQPPQVIPQQPTLIPVSAAPAPAAAPQPPPVMHLVNTINGPMLMQAAPVTAPPHMTGKPDAAKKAGPQPQPQQQQQAPLVQGAPNAPGHFPILVSPQGVPQGQVLISQPSPAGSPNVIHAGAPQYVLNQPTAMLAAPPNQVLLSSNGTLMTVPTAVQTGVVYNQLPDGSLVQVQAAGAPGPGATTSAPTTALIPHPGAAGHPQQIMTSHGPIIINNPAAAVAGQVSPQAQAGGQLLQPGAPAYIMTPQGLVQASGPPLAAAVPHQQQQQQTHPLPSPGGAPPGGQYPQQQQQQPQMPQLVPIGGETKTERRKESDHSEAEEEEEEDPGDPEPIGDVVEMDLDDDEPEHQDHRRKEPKESSDQEEEIGEGDASKELFDVDDDDEDEEDEVDDSSEDEEEVPLAKKKSSPPVRHSKKKRKKLKGKGKSSKRFSSGGSRTYLQSNKIDSSGLEATPPHHPPSEDYSEEHASSSKLLSSPEGLVVSTSSGVKDSSNPGGGLDTSGGSLEDGSAIPSTSSGLGSGRHRRKRAAAMQPIIQDSDDESDDALESPTPSNQQFNVGELVWGPYGSFPSWPGKLVRFERDGSRVLVCWFGSRETSQVDPHHLQSLSDGLEAHHQERKKLRKGRKINASLEKAIQEAMSELDRMTDST